MPDATPDSTPPAAPARQRPDYNRIRNDAFIASMKGTIAEQAAQIADQNAAIAMLNAARDDALKDVAEANEKLKELAAVKAELDNVKKIAEKKQRKASVAVAQVSETVPADESMPKSGE